MHRALLGTLIVRSFVVPAILSILGPWFWWPTLVRSRPLRQGSPPHLAVGAIGRFCGVNHGCDVSER